MSPHWWPVCCGLESISEKQKSVNEKLTNLVTSQSHSLLETSFSCRTAEQCALLVLIQFQPSEHNQMHGYLALSAELGYLSQPAILIPHRINFINKFYTTYAIHYLCIVQCHFRTSDKEQYIY